MYKTELHALLVNGEDSGVEFKRDGVRNYNLAKEIAAFLNLDGGTVLLGINDDGSIAGTSRKNLEEWIAELCRVNIDPPIIPYLSWIRGADPGKNVLAIQVPIGPDKPYARVHNSRHTYYVRVGSTSQEASRDELERMFQASGRLQYGLKPVPGATIADFDLRRLHDYQSRILAGPVPEDILGWEILLQNLELATQSAGQLLATINGLLLFGKSPQRFLPQCGIRALAYPEQTPTYAARADEDLVGPMAPLGAFDGVAERGVADQAWDFVRRNTSPTAQVQAFRRIDRWDYPQDVLREVVVNALIHRDYSVAGTNITLAIYPDRLEVVSPGRLPNTVTPDRMRAGLRYARNQTLVNVMRDYGYADARGMGVRNKVIPGMLSHNDTEPDLIAEEHQFTVRLWRKSGQGEL